MIVKSLHQDMQVNRKEERATGCYTSQGSIQNHAIKKLQMTRRFKLQYLTVKIFHNSRPFMHNDMVPTKRVEMTFFLLFL